MIRFIVLVTFIVTCPNAWAQAQIQAVVNAASFQPGLPAGGALATVFVSGLRVKPGTYIAPSSSPLPFELGGIQIYVNDLLAPILAVVIPAPGQSGYAQINFQVPLERNASILPSPSNVFNGFMTVGGATISPLPALSQWGGFFSDANGFAIAQHASDYSTVTSQNPAHPGETIIVYADDFFPVWPPPPIGYPTPPQPLFTVLAPSMSIIRGPGYLYLQDYPISIPPHFNSYASTPALQINFQGLAPGQIGVEQINFVVPSNQQPGDWALFFNSGSCPDGNPTPGKFGTSAQSSPFVKLPVR